MLSFQHYSSIDEAAESGLAAKASKSGVSIGTLRKVYKRGVAAWNSGHRPGTTPQQWGMARVNSYIGKGSGTYHGADKDLREEELQEKKLPEVPKDKESGLPKKYVAGLSASTAKARAAHFAKADKLSDSDPEAYKPAPGDANAKTKPSKHTLKYRAMFGEDMDEEIYEACWDTHKQIGMKKKGNRMVPDCVPKNEEIEAQFDLIEELVMNLANKHNIDPEVIWEEFETVDDVELFEAAVDAKGHKSSTGGLTQKGRDAYNAKGANLQAPVTTPPSKLKKDSKAAKRRRSFCARMGGMEGAMKKPNGEPTRKALALRKWNC